MFSFTFPLTLCLALASGRGYRLRAPPSVSHSVVNLGKMELNVYLNSKPAGSPINEFEIPLQSKPIHGLRSESGECPCQQNRLKNRNQDIFSPPDMLSKILMNNDLFKEPVSSSSCCSSHEQIQEEFYMEFNPKTRAQSERQELPAIQHLPPIVQTFPPLEAIPMSKPMFKPMQYLPLLIDSLYKGPQKQKPKMVEIFLFPTKKPVSKTTAKGTPVTPEIKVVGDRKTTMVYDLLAANSSVKKDLNKEVVEHLKDMEAVINTDKTTHTISNNTV